jgi:6-phosphogluconate dehydrogenase
MKLGFVGLGKMGGFMAERLLKAGHELVALDPDERALEQAASLGATVAGDRADLVAQLCEKTEGDGEIAVWLMIPASIVDAEVDEFLALLPKGSVLVDGGNSDFRLTRERAARCDSQGVRFVDVGTSGGILGREQGYALMVGGDAAAVKVLSPAFDSLAPADGWRHFGESGNGHYVKMVHNAIEYGMMEAYAEGYRMLKDGPARGIDLAAAGSVWQRGSIVESLLNRLAAESLAENPELAGIDGYVTESGETRWALEAAREAGVEMPSIAASFDVRLRSQRGETNFATKLLAAMRNKFGGHALNAKG